MNLLGVAVLPVNCLVHELPVIEGERSIDREIQNGQNNAHHHGGLGDTNVILLL